MEKTDIIKKLEVVKLLSSDDSKFSHYEDDNNDDEFAMDIN